MALGQAIYQDFVLLSSNPDPDVAVLDIPDFNRECCFQLPVLAQIDGIDPLKNDQSSKFFFFDKGFTAAVMILERFNGVDWSIILVLSDDQLGTLYEYGFKTNSKGEKMMGFILDWKKLLEDFGTGTYRIKAVADTIFGSEVEFFSFEYCLKKYSPYLADKTVRINFWQTGVMGNLDDDTKTKDFGDFTAFGQIRLPNSFFGLESSTYEDSYVRYTNGQQKWLTDAQDQFFVLDTGRFPAYIHDHIRADILQADQISITDFNSINPNKQLIDKLVRRTSAYEPNWVKGSLFASVQIKFMKEYKNFVHKRC